MAKPAFRNLLLFLMLFLWGALLAPAQSLPSSATAGIKIKQSAMRAPDRLLVRFRKGTAPDSACATHRAVSATVLRRFRTIGDLELLKLPKGVLLRDALHFYRRQKQVLYAEPDYVVQALATTPNDPSFGQLWGLQSLWSDWGPDHDIDAPEAWDITTGSSDVVVGVIDTGIDYNHPDLAANVYRNESDCNNNGIDDDGNGYIDDCYGIDTINHDSDPMDDHFHGTHVSGTIGAVGNNSRGVVGVNWHVKIAACKFLGGNGYGYTSGALECLDYFAWMKDHGMNLVATSNSWGGGEYSQALIDAIDRQADRDILFVAAAGNSGDDADATPHYPAAYDRPNIISVAATTRGDGLAYFSTYGRASVDIGAPGVDILSTSLNGGYQYASGTSMATPHVSGVVALLKAQDPTRDWRTLKYRILAGGDLKSYSLGGKILTERRLNAYGSLTCADRAVASRVAPGPDSVAVGPGATITLRFFSIGCDHPTPGPLQVTVAESGQVIELRDDGVAPDTVANDGLFAGTFIAPAVFGAQTLTFPSGPPLVVDVTPLYSYTKVPMVWRDVVETPVDSNGVVNLPFPIHFATGSEDALHISNRGVISFADAIPDIGNRQLPTTDITVPFVAPWWQTDLQPTVSYGITGEAPNRELVLNWRAQSYYSSNYCYDDNELYQVVFQVVFSEAKNDVLMNYRDTLFDETGSYCPPDNAGQATVGIQIGDGLATQFSYNTASLNNEDALLWTSDGQNPVPAIAALNPASAPAGSGDLTLSVEGSGFVMGSELRWNGVPQPSARTSPSRITATIPASSIAAQGSAEVMVRNPGPGGGDSNVASFTIGPPASITVTAPNGAETWQAGTAHTVTWQYSGDPGLVRVELTCDQLAPQVIGTHVAAGQDGNGSFVWNISAYQTPSTRCRVGVRSESYSRVNDVGDAAFTIVAPAVVTLTSPNGGESWGTGSTHTVSWTYSSVVPLDGVELLLVRSDGSNWYLGNYPVGSAGSGSAQWVVGGEVGTGSDYRLRISAWDTYIEDWWTDESDAPFTITSPGSIQVLAPNGGESWASGSTHNLSWTTSGNPGSTVRIELLKGGALQSTLASGLSAASGNFSWSIPSGQAAGTDYRVRIVSETLPGIQDTSDADFAVTWPQLSVSKGGSGSVASSPSGIDCGLSCGGQVASFAPGTAVTLTATPAAGFAFTGWSGACAGTGTCQVTMSQDRMVVATFAATNLTVTAPNGGESWTVGTAHAITWTRLGNPGNTMQINLLKGGVFQYPIASGVAVSTGTYNWAIPQSQAAGSDYRVQIVTTDGQPQFIDTSDGDFTVTVPPTSLHLASPNGGESWNAGTAHAITWSYTGTPGNLRVELLNGSTVVQTISTAASPGSNGSGSLSWTIPGTTALGVNYRVRITSTTNSAVTDSSDAAFRINRTGVLVLSPNGGENWTPGTMQTVRWTSYGAVGTLLRIDLLKSGAFSRTLTTGTAMSTGQFNWTVPSTQTVGSDYRIRIMSTLSTTYTDQSDANFGITTTGITLTSPNGGEVWAPGSTHNITWTSSGSPGSDVKVDLLKGGVLNTTLAAAVPLGNGSYSWSVPANQAIGADYSVRVTSNQNPQYADTSNANFTIDQRYTLTVTKTGTGTATITSSPAGINCPSTCSATFSVGTPVTLTASPAAGTTFNGWSGACSGTGACQVTMNSDMNVGAAFTGPTTGITVTSPNGGEVWLRGTIHQIKWTYSGSVGTAVKIELLKSGVLSRTLSFAAPIGTNGVGTLNWIVSTLQPVGSDYTVRITSTTQTTVKDVSNAPFTIQ